MYFLCFYGFSVLPGADEGAKSTAPAEGTVERQAESFANIEARDTVVNQGASDWNKESTSDVHLETHTTDAPLEPHGEVGASIQLIFII